MHKHSYTYVAFVKVSEIVESFFDISLPMPGEATLLKVSLVGMLYARISGMGMCIGLGA